MKPPNPALEDARPEPYSECIEDALRDWSKWSVVEVPNAIDELLEACKVADDTGDVWIEEDR